MLTIALTKGRILKETLPLLAKVGIEPLEDISKSRKLIFPTTQENVRLVILRGVDVPTYVQFGAADVAVAGKDVIMEHGGEGYYEPLDLKIAPCQLMTATVKNRAPINGRLRVATKYINLAKTFYAKQGTQVEMIKLYGAMELAPIMDLADEIVDIVDTGNTLKANGLESVQVIAQISSRLIVNKAAMKLKNQQIKDLINALEKVV